MNYILICILCIIRFCFCCEDVKKISLLAPFNDLATIQSIIGEDIILVCCHPDGADNLIWENKDGKVISFTNTGGIFSLKDEKNRLILRIDNIDDKGMGLYNCKNPRRGLTRPILISLKPRPLTPVIKKIEKILPKSNSIRFECPLQNRQTFKSWRFTEGNQNFIKSKPGKGKNFEISDNGLNFTLIMNNNAEPIKIIWCEYQEVNSDGNLFNGLYEFTWVLYDPINVAITMTNKGPILESDDVTLICSYNHFAAQVANFPDGIVKSSFNITTIQGQITLIIPKITKDLENEYRCKVTNFLSQAPFKIAEETAKIKVDVVVPPKIMRNNFLDHVVKIDEDAFLKCEVISKQLGSVFFERFNPTDSSWVMLDSNSDRYNTQLNREDQKNTLLLFISKIKWDDRGKYRCSASNAAGKDSVTGVLKVEKTPELSTKSNIIDIAMKPVKIDCSLSGYPIYNTSDILELRVVNETSNIIIKLLKRNFDELEGLQMIYEVAILKKIIEGETYNLECYYQNARKMYTTKKSIELRIASSPDTPKVKVKCTGSSGIVFEYEKPVIRKTPKDVTKNELYFAPSNEYDSIIKKPSKIIPINNENESKYFVYVLKGLLPNTNYSFKWESYNSFQISNFINLWAKTKVLSAPQTPTSMEFSTQGNMIGVAVKWDDDCPYEGANSAIEDVVVNMKPLDTKKEITQNWNWVETNFTVDIKERNLKFLIALEKPQINYEIQVGMRSKQGSSDFITVVYKADVVLAGSLFSCFPRCLGQTLSSSPIALKLAIIASVVFLRMI